MLTQLEITLASMQKCQLLIQKNILVILMSVIVMSAVTIIVIVHMYGYAGCHLALLLLL
jgi:hypothetical protein